MSESTQPEHTQHAGEWIPATSAASSVEATTNPLTDSSSSTQAQAHGDGAQPVEATTALSQPEANSQAISTPACNIDLTAESEDDDALGLVDPFPSLESVSASIDSAASSLPIRKRTRAASPFDPECVEVIDLLDETKEYNPPPPIRRKVIKYVVVRSAAAAESSPPPPTPPPAPPAPPTIVEVEKSLSCHICLEAMTHPVATPCGHIFCFECITQSITVKKSCPDCRHKLTKASKLIRLYI